MRKLSDRYLNIMVIENIRYITFIVFWINLILLLSNSVDANTQEINRVIIILIDSARADRLYANIGPGFGILINNSIKFDKSYTVFPSITPAAHSSIFTGKYPDKHGIAGYRWFNKINLDYNDYGTYPGKISMLINEDLMAQTIFESAKPKYNKSVSVFEFIRRGAEYEETIEAMIYYARGQYIQGDDEVFDEAEDYLRNHRNNLPNIMAIWVPGVDEMSHKEGPNSPMVDDVYKNLDDRINTFIKFLQNDLHIYNETLIVITSDHGQTFVGNDGSHNISKATVNHVLENEVALTRYLTDFNSAKNCKTSCEIYYPYSPCSCAVVAPNGGMTQIYITNNKSWNTQPTEEEVKRVAQAFVSKPYVKEVVVKYNGSDGYWKYNSDGTLEDISYFDIYPNGAERVWGLTSERSGDIILTANYPYYFEDRPYIGVHGNLNWKDTETPLIFSHSRFGSCTQPVARNTQIAPTIAKLMNFDMGLCVDDWCKPLFNSSFCSRGTCTDSIKNNDETDVDCGGPCQKCSNNNSCSSSNDCQSNYCNPTKLCTTPTCNDSILNNLETGIDCGGPYCSPCTSTVFINATIHNIGKANASYVYVRFEYSNETIIEGKTLASVPANGSRVAGISYTAIQNTSHTLCVKIDPENLTLEKTKSNNIACKNIHVPFKGNFSNRMPSENDNLGVKSSGVVDVSANDTNSPAPTENTINRFVNITATGPIESASLAISYEEDSIERLNESSLKMYYWNDSWVLINDSGVDADSNLVLANVTSFSVFTALGIEKADLELSNVSLNSTRIVEGRPVRVYLNVSNTGGESASSVVQFYDVDADYNVSLLGNISVSLDVNDTKEIAVNWNATIGLHYVYVLADPYDDISESNESNNVNWILVNVSANSPPILSNISNQSVNEGQFLQFTLTAADPDNDTLTFTAAGMPYGAVFNASTFSWTPSYVQAGNYTVTFTVSDGLLNDSQNVSITVDNVLVFGTIYEKDSGNMTWPSENATVAVMNIYRNQTMASAVTDANGKFWLVGSVADGNYFINLSKDGYKQYWGLTILRNSQSLPFSVILVPVEGYGESHIIQGPVFQGSVSDASGSLQGADIRLFVTSGFGYTLTAKRLSDGYGRFYFVDDITTGSYRLISRKPGYRTNHSNISIDSQLQELNITLVRLPVLAGTVYGFVEPYPYPYQDSYQYLEGVNVSIVETGDWDISTWYGKFEIYSDRVVSGNVYTIRAVKSGYITQERRVNITLGYGVTSVTFWMNR